MLVIQVMGEGNVVVVVIGTGDPKVSAFNEGEFIFLYIGCRCGSIFFSSEGISKDLFSRTKFNFSSSQNSIKIIL